MLWFMGLQRVGHDWATALNWTEIGLNAKIFYQNWRVLFNMIEESIYYEDLKTPSICALYNRVLKISDAKIIEYKEK